MQGLNERFNWNCAHCPAGREQGPRSKLKLMAQENGQIVRVRDARREYRMGEAVIRAVDGVSLEVGRGEFLALLGSSGSGKSTLLNLVAGLDRPTSGAIEVDGRELGGMSSLELAQF